MNIAFYTRLMRVCSLAILCCATVMATAQERRATFDVGGGFTPPVGQLGTHLNMGWNAGAGAGVNLNPWLSLGGRFLYNTFGINDASLAAAGVPGGDAHVWSLTAEPKIQLGVSRFSPYIVGGVGYYRRTVNFTAPTLTTQAFYDPFYDVFFPGVVPANQVLSSVTRGGIGGNLGFGLQFGLGEGTAKFFTEARYHYADTGNTPTRMIPVTFGIRF